MKIRTLGPIGHCSARLRRALEIEEEHALRWRVKVRPIEGEKKNSNRGRRWIAQPRFSMPGPFGSSRPISAKGHVSFHFSLETVSKGPKGTSIITGGARSRILPPTAAADHDKYTTGPGAVLAVSAADFDRYASTSSTIEIPSGRVAAVLSNISDDPSVRCDFWRKVHEHERNAKADKLVFYRNGLTAAEWRALAQAECLPQSVRETAAAVAERSPGKSKRNGDAFIEMDHQEARNIRQAALEFLEKKHPKRDPFKIVKGRGGRTQFRLTAEFPTGLNASARLRIMIGFCKYLEETRVMYTAAIHAPDEHNDARNDHLHIAYYDRPCSRLEDGRWDFEVKEKVAGQHNRFRYPKRQPKVASMSRASEGENYRAHRATVIYRMREKFAELCNDELRQAGISRLFDPRTYETMGIERTPTKPLGTGAAPLEAAGVPTRTGIANAEIVWTFALEQARLACKKRQQARDEARRSIAESLERLSGQVAPARIEEPRARLKEMADLSAFLDLHEAEIEEFRVTLEMAYARPNKTVDTCQRILAAIEDGKGSAADRRDQALIIERRNEANAFIQEIDSIMMECMKTIKPIREQVGSARARFAVLQKELPKQLEVLTHGIGAPEGPRTQPDLSHRQHQHTRASSLRETIDKLLERILDQHLVRGPSGDQPLYTVRGISREEYQILSQKQYESWVQSRLAKIAEIQTARAKGAAARLRQFGYEELQKQAASNSSVRRALHHLEVYREHPALRGSDDATPGLGRLAVPRPSEPRLAASAADQVGSAVAGASDPRVIQQMASRHGEATENSATVRPSWTPRSDQQPPSPPVPDKEREEAVKAYAEFIRTGPGIEFDEIDGQRRVKIESAGDWRTSAWVFEDEEEVKEAIEERARHEEEQKRDAEAARAAEQEMSNALVRSRIIDELRRSAHRPLYRDGDKWDLSGLNRALIEPATAWQDHPELDDFYKQVDQYWTEKEKREAAQQHVIRENSRGSPKDGIEPPLNPGLPGTIRPMTTVENHYLAHREKGGIGD